MKEGGDTNKQGKLYHLEDRIPGIKKQRKRKANSMLIIYLSVFFILIAVILYFQSPFSHVQEVKVTGTHYVSQDEVVSLADVSQETSFVQLQEDEVAKRIENHEEIAQATVTKHFPNEVNISIKEHQRLAYIEKEGRFHPLLDNGVLLSDVSEEQLPTSAPLLESWNDDEALKIIAAELEDVPELVLNAISTVTYAPTADEPMRVIVYMNDGYEIHTMVKGFAQKMADYPSIVAQLDPEQKGVIHLGVASYFKAYGEEDASKELDKHDEENESQ
ncbi:FtsQ-type POTRA domain-containing protein [Bacillaceae bacterium SIJ1]|uniref:cell division protein FtsQ/DivIB n=1 Tax=Litoribacterium kuwaitense TaxID=1398745 RepID=UPI0013EB6268|nr:FtsQ-type POTRA domain-containing protein [Litoribacterium kuwaitense]NGP44341.1 FtsQ-type POTRA domain-containing protein [Litoribacterium kuwaitense]